MFTSGTTGRSKGVMLSQKNLFTAMPAFLTPFEDVRSQTGWNTDAFSSLSCLPMFHISAMTSLVSWSITGHCVNLCNDLKYFYRDLGAMRSDVMAVVPVLLKSIYSDVMKGRRDRLNGLCVLTCGAAMFDPKILSDMMEKGFFVAQMYGLTETCGDGAWNSSQEAKYLTSVGHVDDSCQYKLEDGELCMRGDPVMLGYYKDPEATAEVIDADGWFHTGDLARKDEDGYYFLIGRKKNLIILDSGENISPEELEGIVGKCEAVKECVVKEMGKKIGVVVYCDEDKQQQVRDFITEANRTLPLYKRTGENQGIIMERHRRLCLLSVTERKKISMERAEIISQILAILEDVAEVSPEDVNENSVLMDDLDLSSMEILTIVADLEETFGLRIPEKELRNFVTIGDLVDYLAANAG